MGSGGSNPVSLDESAGALVLLSSGSVSDADTDASVLVDTSASPVLELSSPAEDPSSPHAASTAATAHENFFDKPSISFRHHTPARPRRQAGRVRSAGRYDSGRPSTTTP
jgi:hypothetical protein